ncbi:SLAP domain-containing protein [Clostridium sp. PL3]|uniref:SLAP domain-containing protein n=1 Tax=Clostridium thailandense TaxID=2794346 RepID=A0A949TSP7_9CLOT|nr:SLAP domain-containing protein [Clostridium thailandense]MBV7272651.1 SLAP domain-containing protein [Clostridium thailandense]
MSKEDKTELDNIKDSEAVELQLSLTEREENIVSDVQKEIMNEELDEFAPVKENDINIATTYVYEDKNEIEAKVYFRNGFTRKVNFEYVPLVMTNSQNEILAKKIFDLREMGDIPPCGARPWKVSFPKSEVDMEKFSSGDCKIIFDAKVKAVNYADIELEAVDPSMEELKPLFEKFLRELPRIEKGNVSFSKFNVALSNDGKIIITLMARNGCNKTVRVEEMPITLKDENNNVAASGIFKLGDFEVSAMKAKMLTLAFDTEVTLDETISLDKWKVVFQTT